MTVELPKKCAICNNDKKFIIQKEIDNGVLPKDIAKKHDVTIGNVNTHINGNHRETLIAFGVMDYTVRKHAIDCGETLANFIEKWQDGFKNRSPDKLKDSDALKAIELYSKLAGKITDKHEITMKRSIEDALTEFLGEDKKE